MCQYPTNYRAELSKELTDGLDRVAGVQQSHHRTSFALFPESSSDLNRFLDDGFVDLPIQSALTNAAAPADIH